MAKEALKLFALRDSSGALVPSRIGRGPLYFATKMLAKVFRRETQGEKQPLFVTYGPDHRKYGGTK